MSAEQLHRMWGYWTRTLRGYVGKPVVIRLIDGRERRGILTEVEAVGVGGIDRKFVVLTEDGPAVVPVGQLQTVEQA